MTSGVSKPYTVVDLQLSYCDFPLLPSTQLLTTTDPSISNPNLPKDKSFADSVNTNFAVDTIEDKSLLKDITYVEGIPQVKWTEQEVIKMTCIEKLQFAVVGNFSYEWLDLEEMR
ncbi:hypothetical protein KY289_026600 [Solanum tuberosum]|nr:hypothetical protein KY289_026600 [Solanum tuberosum]